MKKLNYLYIIYHDGGDEEILERPDGTKDHNVFEFSGFGNFIHPYHKKQVQWAKEMLKSSDIDLHIQEFRTVYDMGKRGQCPFEVSGLKIGPIKKGSGRNLLLMQDTEMGRGWAVLLEVYPCGDFRIITQDHRDTVRDQTLLDQKWLGKQGVVMKRKKVKDLSKILAA
jgi:hypothetical protein